MSLLLKQKILEKWITFLQFTLELTSSLLDPLTIPAVVGNTISKSLLEYLTIPSLSAVTNAKTKKRSMAYFLTSNQCVVGLKKKEYTV